MTIPFANMGAGVLADQAWSGVSYYLPTFALLSLTAFLALRSIIFGRMLYAIGGNREARRLADMRVDLVTISIYMQCAALGAKPDQGLDPTA